ncbi:MAG: hypothetical protein ACREFI_04490, partial [Stellaceae bacterium]
MEETTSERKTRVAELAKAIKAKKAALDKEFTTVTTEVKRSLTVQEGAVKRTRTVLEEAQRQDAEVVASTRQVEEVRGKSGVIRRRAKPGAEPVPEAPVARTRPESIDEPETSEPVRETREPEAEAQEEQPAAESGPGLIRRAGRDVTPASARVTP